MSKQQVAKKPVEGKQSYLRLTEIFYSIQGESTYAGLPCIFIRTTGCDLRCTWCDTEYAFYGGRKWRFDEILEHIRQWPCTLVELTGGEPLLQKALPEFATLLLDRGYTVLIETGGHRDISVLDRRVVKIMDIKCPGSGEAEKNHWPNLRYLEAKDQVKFVVRDRADFDWAVEVIRKHDLQHGPQLLFSPVWGELEYEKLAEWLLQSGLRARLQTQLHKIIWGPDRKGV
ncbi:MAG: radical SAM protein [candidate division KSB1 bacterium]|nr:radical SAM protein [candidate division KSB1 bacterium]